ncbi:hypothetical protein [Cellulophaga lytica]|uniref:hypothetical protein n=1 Tax=Cellulophaga lytica TaxID=979 RepID=UPI000B5C9A3A|nr:hypothetical protein [Cellulophaga lytica]
MSTDKKNIQKNDTKTTYNPNITDEDLQAIGKKGLSVDTGDDELLQNRKERIDFQGKDLDIPGRNETKKSSKNSLTDEENSLYGQGGELKENLEAPERANTNKDNL